MRIRSFTLLLVFTTVFSACSTSVDTIDVTSTVPVSLTTSAPATAAISSESSLIRVIDGDTIVVNVDGVEEKVRLVGIDTPERGECGFAEATQALELLLSLPNLGLVEAGGDDRDRYGRLLRYLNIDGQDPGLELIRAGLAKAAYDSRTGYGKHTREDSYISLDEITASLCP
jgi:micrococcal nuclease